MPSDVSLLVYKLAVLAVEQPQWHPANNPEVAELAGSIMDLVDVHLHDMDPKHVVLVTWNVARMKHYPRQNVVKRILAKCMTLLQQNALEPDQVANLAFSLSWMRDFI